jgi:arsenic resistance protein ArsH
MRKESGWRPMYKPVKDLPNISAAHLDTPTVDKLMPATVATHPPRMLCCTARYVNARSAAC